MAKSAERIRARELRAAGHSVKEIARELGVSKGSASVWCRDIELLPEQIEVLNLRMEKGSYRGRMEGAQLQRDRRLQIKSFLESEGERIIGKLNNRELLLLGLALYMGEGTRKGNRVSFANSDPDIIRIMIRWFEEVWRIPKDMMIIKIGVNEVHQARKETIEQYWSEVTGISRDQFQKTTFIKTRLKKIYENHLQHFGTVQLRIRKSASMLNETLGLIHGVYQCNTAG